MSVMNFHTKWKQFLNEEQDLTLLLEARVKDVKAKYKVLDESGWINWARRQIEDVLGPKGVSKYLMYWSREMDRKITVTDPDELRDDRDVLELGEGVLDLIINFQQNQPRIEEKDIYKYDSEQLKKMLESLGLTSKERKTKEKEEAVEGSDVVYDDDDIFAVRVYTEEASCYYGKNTQWCISATESENWFNKLTMRGNAFVIARMINLPENDVHRRITLVYRQNGDLDHFADVTNDPGGVPIGDFYEALAKNHTRTGMNEFKNLDYEEQEEIRELAQEIIDLGTENVMENPPDAAPGIEKQIEKIEEEYRDTMEHASYGAEYDEYLHFWGGFTVEIDNDRFEGGAYTLPTDWRGASALNEEIRDRLDREVSVYAEEVAFDDFDGGVPTFEIRISTDGYNATPNGYESFLSELQTMDEKYAGMVRVVEKYLMEEGYIAKGAFENLSDRMEEIGSELKNFTWYEDEDAGDEFIKFESEDFEISGVPSSILRRISDIEKVGSRRIWQSPSLTKGVVMKLGNLHQKITSFLEKQLELPISDLPPRVVKEITIPEFLRIELVADPAFQEEIKSRIVLGIDDVTISEEAVEATIEVVKFVDQNFLEVRSAVIDSIRDLRQKVKEEEKRRTDSLQDSTKRLLDISRQFEHSDRLVRHYLSFVDDWKLGLVHVSDEAMLQAVTNLYNHLKDRDKIPEDLPEPQSSSLQESFDLQDEINKYLNEEKGRSRQRGIYKFYCMIGYSVDPGQKSRGLEDILADLRALPNVTIVTVVVSNRRIAEQRYISGLAVKFIPSTPGQVRSPEDTKARILRDLRRVRNVERIFKISTSVERIE